METIDVFFYRLSRKIYGFWDLIVESFNEFTNDEKLLFLGLSVLLILFFVYIFILILRVNFNKRVKKLNFVNVLHINIVNEVSNKNIFARVFLFFWNLKKLVLVDGVSSKYKIEESDEVVDKQHIENSDTKTQEETEPKVIEENETVVTNTLPLGDIDDMIEKRVSELKVDLKKYVDSELMSLKKQQNESTSFIPTPQEKEIVVVSKENTLSVDQVNDVINVQNDTLDQEDLKDETVIVEQLEIEKVNVENNDEIIIDKEQSKDTTPVLVVDEEEIDDFFSSDRVDKYIVSKHSISGWQVKKIGAKRASRLFNSKKQAIAYVTKEKLDYEIQ